MIKLFIKGEDGSMEFLKNCNSMEDALNSKSILEKRLYKGFEIVIEKEEEEQKEFFLKEFLLLYLPRIKESFFYLIPCFIILSFYLFYCFIYINK